MTRVVHEEPVAEVSAAEPKKKSRLLRWLIRLAIFVAVIVGGLALIYFTAPDHYNILLVGSDQRGTERARSDVLILVSIPKKTPGSLILLTIPRDTKVEDPVYGLQKITHFYALGDREEGSVLGNIDLTKSVIERELNVPIHATAEVTFSSFEQLINDIGGVAVSSGTLTGAEALAVVRDRYRPGGDFARAADQREIVEAILGKFQSLNLLDQVYSYLTTNQQTRLRYSQREFAHFAVAFVLSHLTDRHLPRPQEEVLPGVSDRIYTPEFGKSLYYFVLDTEATNELLDRTIR